MTQKYQQNLAKGYDVKIGEYFSKGWAILNAQMGLFIAFSLLYLIGSGIIGQTNGGLSILFNILVAPCLVFGYDLVSRATSRNESVEFNSFFKGFDHFGKLVGISLLSGIFSIIIFIPFLIYVGVSIFSAINDTEAIKDIIISNIAFFLFSIIASIFVSVLWFFASKMAVFHGLGVWEAMEASRKIVMKNWVMMFLLSVVVVLVIFAGILVLCFGIIVSIPLSYCMMYAAFDDIVGLPEEDEDFDDEISSISVA